MIVVPMTATMAARNAEFNSILGTATLRNTNHQSGLMMNPVTMCARSETVSHFRMGEYRW